MQNQFIELYRNGMKTATDVARMSLENGIRLQERQLEIARGILDEQSRSADQVGQAKSMEELVALQSRMASAQLGRVVEFWSNLWQAAAQNQGEAFRNLQSFTTRSSEEVASAAASQISRAAGSVRESGNAANHDRKNEGQRKSA